MHSLVLVELETATDYPKLRKTLAKVNFRLVVRHKAAGLFLYMGEAGNQRPEQVVQALSLLTWLHCVQVKRISAFETASRECDSLPTAEDLAALLGFGQTLQSLR